MTSPDYQRIVERLIPKPDGESPVRHRTGEVVAVNGDGTVDLDLSGVTVPDVATIGSTAVGQIVQVLVWAGDLLVLSVTGGSDYALLGEVTSNGSSGTMTISGIPQTHRDLLGIVHGSHPAVSGQQQRTVSLRLNNDSGTNYRVVRIDTDDNGVPTRSSGLAVNSISLGGFGDDTDLSSARFEIPDYSQNRNKSVTFQSGSSFGGSAGQSRAAQGWGSHVDATALTDVRVIMSVENWRTGSGMRLYGLGRK